MSRRGGGHDAGYHVTQALAIDLRTGMILRMEMGRLPVVWQDEATLLLQGQRSGRQTGSGVRPPTFGLFSDGRGACPGNRRPIVTREVFDQVQERIAERHTGGRR